MVERTGIWVTLTSLDGTRLNMPRDTPVRFNGELHPLVNVPDTVTDMEIHLGFRWEKGYRSPDETAPRPTPPADSDDVYAHECSACGVTNEIPLDILETWLSRLNERLYGPKDRGNHTCPTCTTLLSRGPSGEYCAPCVSRLHASQVEQPEPKT